MSQGISITKPSADVFQFSVWETYFLTTVK